MAEETVSSWCLGNNEERGQGWGLNISFKVKFSMTQLLSTGSNLQKVSPSNSVTDW
jgi:hypothetical protein